MHTDSSRSMRLILNGKSAGGPEIRAAVEEIRQMGYPLEVRVTWESGDAARYAVEAAVGGIDVVIAGGGDGTINEVVCGMLRADATAPAVAVLPLGTANDFANGCGIPTDDPLAALKLAAEGPICPIDVGQANDRYFINVASGGFGAEVTASTPPELKKALGGAAYSLMGVITAAKMTPHPTRVTLPDGTVHQGDVFAMAVGNSRQCGGGQQLTPRALLDDGLIDVMIVHGVDLQSLGTVLSEMLSIGDESNQKVAYAQLESFRIECPEGLQVNLDGEPVREQVYDFRVLPRAIRFVLPPEAPLVGSQT